MTTNYHTAISVGAAANAATFNSPLGALDAAITNAQTGVYNVLEYGATGDGTTDDSTAIQAALDACIAAGGGTVIIPAGTYAIATDLTIAEDSAGVRIVGEGSGAPFTTPKLLWTGASGATETMLKVGSHSQGISIAGLVFDGDDKAGICIHLDAVAGENIHRPHLARIHFEGYTSRGLIIGSNSTSVLSNGQMQIGTFEHLTFYGGTAGAIGILINAQNAEWSNFSSLYFDPYPGSEHLNHIYQKAGGLSVMGMVSTRASGYAIVSADEIGIYNWRSEDRYLVDMSSVDPSGPSVISNVEQRYDATAAPLYDDYTIKIYHVAQVVTITSVLLQGSIYFGPTDRRLINATGIYFVQGGSFLYYSNTRASGIMADANTGETHFLGIETITADVTDEFSAGIRMLPGYTAATAKTVTNHNYIAALQPLVLGDGPAAVTHAPLIYFNAAVGTHKALDAGSTKTTPTEVDGWLKVNVADTLYYIPMYTSKTA